MTSLLHDNYINFSLSIRSATQKSYAPLTDLTLLIANVDILQHIYLKGNNCNFGNNPALKYCKAISYDAKRAALGSPFLSSNLFCLRSADSNKYNKTNHSHTDNHKNRTHVRLACIIKLTRDRRSERCNNQICVDQ